MRPSVFLFEPLEDMFQLFLGDFSTVEGLRLFDPAISVEIVYMGAENFNADRSWIGADDLPKFKTAGEAAAFFDEADETIHLIDIDIDIHGVAILSSHDDRECNLVFHKKNDCIAILQKVAPEKYREKLTEAVLQNPTHYIEINAVGEVFSYPTFEQYWAKVEAGFKKK